MLEITRIQMARFIFKKAVAHCKRLNESIDCVKCEATYFNMVSEFIKNLSSLGNG